MAEVDQKTWENADGLIDWHEFEPVAMRLMRDKAVGALPVIDEKEQLVGIVTERDLIKVSARLLERHLAED